MKRKITSILLLVCMIFTMLPMAVSAEGGEPAPVETTKIAKVEAKVAATAAPEVGEDLADDSAVTEVGANYTLKALTWEYFDKGTLKAQNAGTDALPNKVYVATLTFAPEAGFEFIISSKMSAIVVEGSVSNAVFNKIDENGNAIFKITYALTGKLDGAEVPDSYVNDVTSGLNNATVSKDETEENSYAVVDGKSFTIKDAEDAYEYHVEKVTTSSGKDTTKEPTDSTKWNKEGAFTGLSSNTKYRLYIRVSETDTTNVSAYKYAEFTTQLKAQTVSWTESASLVYGKTLKIGTDVKFSNGKGTVSYTPVDPDNWSALGVTWDPTKKEIKAGSKTDSVQLMVTAEGDKEYAKKEHIFTINITHRTENTTTVKVTQADTTYGVALPDYKVTGTSNLELSSVVYRGLDNDFVSHGDKDTAAEKPTEAGEYEIEVRYVSATVEYKATDKFVINKKSISNAKVNLANQQLTYNGQPQTRVVESVVLSGYGLTKNDCDIYGNEATEAGTYTITITAKADTNYTGSVTAKYTIDQKYLSGIIWIGSGLEGCTYGAEYSTPYTGEKIEPVIIFKDTDVHPRDDLKLDKDYTVVYKNNVNAGVKTASITVDMTPTCNYKFTEPVTVYFTIEKVDNNCSDVVASEVLLKTAATNKSVNLATIAKDLFGTGAKVTNVKRTYCDESVFSTAPSYNASANTVTYGVNKDKTTTAGNIATFTFDVESTNYNTKTMTLEINVVNTLDADIKLAGIPEEIVYGDDNFKVTATAGVPGTGTGKWEWSIIGDALKIVSGADTATPTIKVADIGNATIVANYVSGNGDAVDAVTADVVVEKGTITITANSYTININGSIPTLSTTAYTVSGLADGDNLRRTPDKVVYKTEPSSSKAGVFAISVTTGEAGAVVPNTRQYNEEIEYVDGYLVVKESNGTILHFVTNGGTSISSIVRSSAFTQDLTSFKPVREGYEFLGWYSDAKLTNKITSVTVSANSQVFVYADWKKAEATLVFETNNGSKINPIFKTATFTEDLKNYKPVREGYEFAGWYSDKALTKPVTSIKVEKGKTVTVYAKWTAGKAVLKFETNGGSEIKSVSKDKAFTQKLSQYITIRKGYTFVGWYSDAELTKAVSTVDVALGKEVTVYAKWKANVFANPFADVTINDWFYTDVMYVAERGYMNGIEAGVFAPDNTLRRAELVTVLHRITGSPMVNVKCAFTDIVTDGQTHWAYDAIIWANANGIVTGKSDTSFDPEGAIRREEMVAILYRYAKYANVDTTKSTYLTRYTDGNLVNDWARDAFAWAIAEGIITTRDGALAPQADATRAEVAKALHAFDLLLNK